VSTVLIDLYFTEEMSRVARRPHTRKRGRRHDVYLQTQSHKHAFITRRNTEKAKKGRRNQINEIVSPHAQHGVGAILNEVDIMHRQERRRVIVDREEHLLCNTG
jgi:hypothetical protein